jgi:hypothetical protein
MFLVGTLGSLLWSLLVLFFMVMYFMIILQVIIDVFRNPIGVVPRIIWLLLILAVPLISLIVYLLMYGKDMSRRAGRGGSVSDPEDATAQQLLATGAINDAEYAQLRAQTNK